MKKSILGLGSAAAIIAPIAGVVACDDDSKEKEKSLSEILASKIIVLETEKASAIDATLLTNIKNKIEEVYGLDLRKAHSLSVTSNKSGSTTFATISAVKTDTDAKKVYVTVMDPTEKKVVENLEIKVRTENAKELNTRRVKVIKDALNKNYDTAAKALDLATDVANGIDANAAYTIDEALISLKAKIKAASWSDATIDGWIDDSDVTLTIKKFGTTAAAASGDNTVDLSTAKKIELEIVSSTGEAADKITDTVSFNVKTT